MNDPQHEAEALSSVQITEARTPTRRVAIVECQVVVDEWSLWSGWTIGLMFSPFHAMWQPRLFLPTQPQLSPSKRARDKFRVMSFICKARRAVECVCVWLEWLMAWLEGPLRYVTIKTIMFHLPVSSQKIVGRKKKTCTLNHSVVGSTNTLWLYWGDCSLYLMCFSDHFWPPFIWKQISVLCDSQIWLVMMAFRL